MKEHLVAALPSTDELADRQEALHIKELEGQDLLMYSPVEARYLHELFISVFRSARSRP